MSLTLFHDTIVAAATPQGRSALAIVRVSGPDAVRIVADLSSRREDLLTLASGRSLHTEIGIPVIIDDVVVHIHRAPASYTGEDLVEISCHGSQVIVERIIVAASSSGARLAEPGEFSRRAFWNGKITLEQAELIPLKIDATSDAQLRGSELGLQRKFSVLRRAYNEVLELVALIDAEIDFGDSDSIVVPNIAEKVERATSALQSLVEESSSERLNAGYYTVALTGAPNVGKSSLFNLLLRSERSIVSEIPGTTRDYLEAYLDIEGFRVKIIDTAGVRDATESIEERGIALGRSAAQQADHILLLTSPEDRDHVEQTGLTLVHNKSDLDGYRSGFSISTKTGSGLPELHMLLVGLVRAFGSELSRPQLLQGEREILVSVLNDLNHLETSAEPALLADDLRSCLENIGLLLGMTTSVESLNYIFSSMCIGK
jgi:tRNA modification GTPase